MAKMTREERNDAIAMLYLKERNITECEQITEKDREVIYSILDK